MKTSTHLIIGCVIFLAGCGIFDSGGSVSPANPLPSGTQVASGTFLNSSKVSGTVRVIRTGAGAYTLRLEAFNTTEALPLMVTATVNGTVGGFSAQLRGTSGNMNYAGSAPDNATWSSAEIRPPGGVTVTTPIATATLQP